MKFSSFCYWYLVKKGGDTKGTRWWVNCILDAAIAHWTIVYPLSLLNFKYAAYLPISGTTSMLIKLWLPGMLTKGKIITYQPSVYLSDQFPSPGECPVQCSACAKCSYLAWIQNQEESVTSQGPRHMVKTLSHSDQSYYLYWFWTWRKGLLETKIYPKINLTFWAAAVIFQPL